MHTLEFHIKRFCYLGEISAVLGEFFSMPSILLTSLEVFLEQEIVLCEHHIPARSSGG